MYINFIEIKGGRIAEIVSDDILIHNAQEALELMMNCSYEGANKLIVYERHLTPAFFDLKTRIAGDILQKFSQYRIQLAIVGDFNKYESKSLRDFIYESNKTGLISFVSSKEEALNIM